MSAVGGTTCFAVFFFLEVETCFFGRSRHWKILKLGKRE